MSCRLSNALRTLFGYLMFLNYLGDFNFNSYPNPTWHPVGHYLFLSMGANHECPKLLMVFLNLLLVLNFSI